ncbi:Polyketide cyclase / dehydrase and lipid transport [Microlunatus flavus]|uniref:Polyketide cyclase / dehydrase and lipid transport n=1 Tax=Microlunatus flavus TaxID=1036181 RepID=A0A1H9GE33_9ACTN|nr:Polyketide cyclase / dehydrase and lipid transport [Microlunatus flavus]
MHCSVVVHRPVAAVFAYAADPDHLPRWASGLAQSEVRRDGETLLVGSPMGDVRVRFVGPNPYGVLDHEVTLPDGSATLNPFRVLSHPEGSELLFTVRQGALSDADLERDAATVQADLERLRDLLEAGPDGRAG